MHIVRDRSVISIYCAATIPAYNLETDTETAATGQPVDTSLGFFFFSFNKLPNVPPVAAPKQ